MSALGKKLRLLEGNQLMFHCPGCNDNHTINIGAGGWGFNKDEEHPTFEPSVLVRSGHYTGRHPEQCWCTYNAEQIAKGEKPSSFKCYVCHSFVRNGQIEFLSDCSHGLAGKTVPLPDFPD